jgi:hypothetical protein
MGKTLMRQLAQLEEMRHLYGAGASSQVEKFLDGLVNNPFPDAESLIRFHDALLFLRAFPQSLGVVRRTEQLLAGIRAQVEVLIKNRAAVSAFEPENVSGIAGTSIEQSFTYEVARWLVERYGRSIKTNWDEEAQARRLGAALPRFLPLLDDDALVEADTPYLKWIDAAAGGAKRDLAWLMKRFESLSLSVAEKTELYDALDLWLKWEVPDAASRTHLRLKTKTKFCHKTPLIRRNRVLLADAFAAAALPMQKLSAAEGAEILDKVREALTVRGRELYGTTRGDASSVWRADVGRGVTIFLWGLPPERRLPLRVYLAGLTFKNGVPINYVEGIGLFDWMEVGFNTFYAYRDGESAWIYAKALKLLHQLSGANCFSVYPYQLGKDNEEAIRSGAFWFYRKLGFRPGRAELLALTLKEEKKMAADASYRVPARTLRKLADDHSFYEIGGRPSGTWDTFSTRNLGIAVQRQMAREFDGNPRRMIRTTSTKMAKTLGADLSEWNRLEVSAFENISLVLSLSPEMSRWSTAEKCAALGVIRAKAAPDELSFLRLMQAHEAMRSAMLKAGSEKR